MKKISLLLGLLILIIGCAPLESSENESPITTIYTSIYPIQYTTERIVGNTADVKTVYPPGVDSHNYEPTSKEITYIAAADAFFFVGGNMESFATTIQHALKKQDLLFVQLSDNQALFNGSDHTKEDDSHHGHDHDPHIWLDPLKMIGIGEIITEALVIQYPEHASLYQENLAVFKEDMIALDTEFTHGLAKRQTDYFLVTHGAYEYWEESYQLKQIPIRGRSSSDEPSQKDLVEVATLADTYGLKHVLFEQNSNDYVSTIMLDYIQGEKRYLHDLEVRTEKDIVNNEDYMSLMKQNLNVLIEATSLRGENNE